MMYPTPRRGGRRSSADAAKANNTAPKPARCAIEPLETRLLMAFTANINFQPDASAVPSGYLKDAGHQFGDRGNGLNYGWTGGNPNTPDRRNFNARERNASSDQLRDTLIKMGDFKWAIDVPNGMYEVKIVAGDPSSYGQNYRIRTEGVLTVDGVSTSANRHVEGTATVAVTDGRMTISSPTEFNDNTLNFVNIKRIGDVNVAPVSAAAAVQTLNPVNDAMVQDGSAASTNFGSSTDLVLKNHSAGYNRETYLTFNISSFANAESAVVRLYGRIADSTGTNLPVAIYPVGTATWSESTITWNNRPPNNSTASATAIIPNSTARWHEWNVTSYVQQQKAQGRSQVSFKLKAVNYYAARFVFNSSEAASNRPELVVSEQTVAAGTSITAPSGLIATSASRTQINLKWNDNSGNETGFRVERRRGETGNFEQVALVGANVKAYSDTGLTEGYTYYYRVQAYNSGGNSAYSSTQGAVNGPGATYDVRNYGAVLNGVTNDAPAIQAAINAAKAAGGGTVLITGLAGIGSAGWTGLQIANANNVVVAGMGASAGLKTLATPSQKTSAYGGRTAFDVQFSTNCTVQNLKLDGNYSGGVPNIPLGVEQSSNVKFIGNKVYNVGGVAAAMAGAGNTNNQYIRNEIYNTAAETRGMWIGNANLDQNGNAFEMDINPLISENHVHDIGSTGVAGHTTGARILNNVIERTTTTGISLGATFDAPTTNALVDGNVVRNNGAFGIQADGNWLDSNHPYVRAYVTDIVVSNNICENNGQAGIWAFYVEDWTITDNISRNNGEHGISMQQARNVVVENNTLYDTRPAGQRTQDFGLDAGAWGVVNGLDNVTISDNFMGQNTANGLRVLNLTRNTILGTNTTVTGTVKNLVLSNNTLSESGHFGLNVADEHVGDMRQLTIVGNVLLNNNSTTVISKQKRIDPIDAPASLTLKALSTSRIELTWTDSSNEESGYRIERKIGTGSWTTVATVGANVTRYENSGLTKGTKYTYRVRGINVYGTIYLPSVERNLTL